jgi:hypothetical protein
MVDELQKYLALVEQADISNSIPTWATYICYLWIQLYLVLTDQHAHLI